MVIKAADSSLPGIDVRAIDERRLIARAVIRESHEDEDAVPVVVFDSRAGTRLGLTIASRSRRRAGRSSR